jgi:hypothetical protein
MGGRNKEVTTTTFRPLPTRHFLTTVLSKLIRNEKKKKRVKTFSLFFMSGKQLRNAGSVILGKTERQNK